MNTCTLTPAQANLELIMLNAEANSIPSSNLYLWLRESGLPSEIAIRLRSFADTTAQVVGSVVSVGKIVLLRIIDFVKANPHMAIGIAIGGAIGALSSMIPFLGPYLAPLAIAVGATLGAVAGHRSDKIAKGDVVNTGLIAVAQDIIEIAKEFFTLIIDIFNIVFQGKQAI